MSKCYLLATPANWFFRRKVPPDLRDKLGRREIKVSLKTGSKQIATKLARALVVETDILFSSLRGNQGCQKLSDYTENINRVSTSLSAFVRICLQIFKSVKRYGQKLSRKYFLT